MIALKVALAMLCTFRLYGGDDPSRLEPVQLKACSGSVSPKRRIESRLGLVRFSVPKKLILKRDSDVDYVAYRVGYGPKQEPEWMNFLFGLSVGGDKPSGLVDDSIHWSMREWKCDEVVKGQEWLGIGRDGRRSRYIKLPFGFAAYRDVSPNAATEFDKVLDGGCCGKGTGSARQTVSSSGPENM